MEENFFLLKITDFEYRDLLGYCAASSGASLPNFLNNFSVQSSRVKKLFLTFEVRFTAKALNHA
jgi:hypothetical protein